jgi:hypothetical protein
VVEEGVRSLTTEVLLAGFGGAFLVFILGAFRECREECLGARREHLAREKELTRSKRRMSRCPISVSPATI